MNPQTVLDFWFTETDPKDWWRANPEFDARVRERFEPLIRSAAQCELFGWRATPVGRLAEILALDQFPRNAWRGTPQAFAQDALALALAQEAVSCGADAALPPRERAFLLMPYMHSESRRVHEEAERLFRGLENHGFELRHKAIVDRFGRYPHRNEVLGRTSTAEELSFLAEPGSRF